MSAAASKAAPVSRATAWKIVLSVVVGVTAVSGLFYASMASDMQLYRMVDEVMKDPNAYQGKTIRVHGHVKGRVLGKTGTTEQDFVIESRPPRAPATIKIEYRGKDQTPDTLKEGAEVVATGTLTADNRLVSTHVSAQCPSKYEEGKKLSGYDPGVKTSQN